MFKMLLIVLTFLLIYAQALGGFLLVLMRCPPPNAGIFASIFVVFVTLRMLNSNIRLYNSSDSKFRSILRSVGSLPSVITVEYLHVAHVDGEYVLFANVTAKGDAIKEVIDTARNYGINRTMIVAA